MRRAAHQLLDAPAVFEDPLAFAILDRAQARSIRADPARWDTNALARRLRMFLAIRSRIAEDMLERAFAEGVRQYVVLGAGLDTFAYRNPHPELRVFELDHPATQEWKRQRLVESGIRIPGNMTFVPADLSVAHLPDVLAAAGLRSDEPSFYAWLGVTPYLEAASVLATLRAIALLAGRGGGVVFDYMRPRESLSLRERIAFEALAVLVASAGEPFRGFFESGELATELRDMGFGAVEDIGPAELNAAYLSGRAEELKLGNAGHIMVAFR
jgi:methyltransferase (TIGR00027 family)